MPLTYRGRGASGTQLDIVCGELVIGTLWKAVLSSTSGGAVSWRWTFHITAGPPGFQHHGNAADVTIAKVMIEESWDAWLKAAGLTVAGG
jgi:hypothetical protein